MDEYFVLRILNLFSLFKLFFKVILGSVAFNLGMSLLNSVTLSDLVVFHCPSLLKSSRGVVEFNLSKNAFAEQHSYRIGFNHFSGLN